MQTSWIRSAFLLAALAICAAKSFAEPLTPELVVIDPLGAQEEVPWIVYPEDGVTVHDAPSTTDTAVLRTLPKGATFLGDYYRIAETDQEWLKIRGTDQEEWVFRGGVYRPHPLNLEAIARHGNLPEGVEIVNRWWALPSTYEPDDLAEIPKEYTTAAIPPRADRPQRPRSDDDHEEPRAMQLRREALQQLIAMFEAAKADGIVLLASSPYRSWDRQVSIYSRNIRRNPRQRSSAPPGHSEHQLGTTLDISYGTRSSFLRKDTPEHDWLLQNAARFGYRQTYRADIIDETGYIEEPWHWRYMGLAATSGMAPEPSKP